ncbi:methyltransferase [Microbacterium sp.]|uniref:methyltransferase n=1 Tax=Microbacterium sp. TaxID=51671 RepID=UPI0039E59FCC
MSTTSSGLWVAYGTEGKVVGTIRKCDEGYVSTIAGADASLGSYPTMEVAKSALHTHLPPGSDWPQFREH